MLGYMSLRSVDLSLLNAILSSCVFGDTETLKT